MRATAITTGTAATAIVLSALSGCPATGVTPGAHHPPTTAATDQRAGSGSILAIHPSGNGLHPIRRADGDLRFFKPV